MRIFRMTVVSMSIAGLLLGSSQPSVLAQERRVGMSLSIGALSKGPALPDWLSLGAGLDLHLSRFVVLCPEIQFWAPEARFQQFYASPAVALNFRLQRIFFGPGLVKRYFVSSSGVVPERILPRLSAGVWWDRVRLSVQVIPVVEHDYAWWATVFSVHF